MSREQHVGTCDRCNRSFGYYLVRNGFNDSVFAYCDSCCYTAIASVWTLPEGAPSGDYGTIAQAQEPYLKPCPTIGHFTAAAALRCPHCGECLDPVKAAEYIERDAPGAAKGWRWQRSWRGLYCMIIDERVLSDSWISRERA